MSTGNTVVLNVCNKS